MWPKMSRANWSEDKQTVWIQKFRASSEKINIYQGLQNTGLTVTDRGLQ